MARITLNGTGSSDPDGDPLTYSWTGPFGTATGPTPTIILGVGEQYHHAHGERWQGRDFIRQRRDYRAQWSCHQNTIQFQLPADLRFCRLPRWKRRRRGAAEEWVHSFVGMVGQYHPKRHDPSRLWGPRLTLLHQTL